MHVVRPYAAADREACLRLFDSNRPHFFTDAERDDFAAFLKRPASTRFYLVIERDGRIVACGGHVVSRDGATATLCWGMVDNALHGIGIGRVLTQARLDAARAAPGIARVKLDTTQHSQGFYARLGFGVEAVTPNFYGPGLDRWDMVLDV